MSSDEYFKVQDDIKELRESVSKMAVCVGDLTNTITELVTTLKFNGAGQASMCAVHGKDIADAAESIEEIDKRVSIIEEEKLPFLYRLAWIAIAIPSIVSATVAVLAFFGKLK